MGVALTPVLKISRKLSTEGTFLSFFLIQAHNVLKYSSRTNSSFAEFNEHIGPSLPKWFKINDRGLRANLLENLSDFLEHVPATVINQDIYPALSEVSSFHYVRVAFRSLMFTIVLH